MSSLQIAKDCQNGLLLHEIWGEEAEVQVQDLRKNFRFKSYQAEELSGRVQGDGCEGSC